MNVNLSIKPLHLGTRALPVAFKSGVLEGDADRCENVEAGDRWREGLNQAGR